MNFHATQKLMNMVVRQSIFIEQVKLGEVQQFNAVLREVEEELRKILSQVKYQTLDGLSKAQLNALVFALRKSQNIIYSRYQQKIIDRLNEFMKATVVQTTIAAASIHAHNFEEDEEESPIAVLSQEQAVSYVEKKAKEDKTSPLFGLLVLAGTGKAFSLLWSRIFNAYLPSGGSLPLPFLQTGISSSMVAVENAIRNAYANKASMEDLLAALVGNDEQSGVLQRNGNHMRTILATIMQHVGQNSIGAATSALWPEYVWVSIIDSVTSDICRERNNRRYQYGNGPLPPAHPNCRSSTMPYWDSDFKLPTFYEWLKLQPESFIADIFGAAVARMFKNGTIRRDDFKKFVPTKPLTIDQFKNKLFDLF